MSKWLQEKREIFCRCLLLKSIAPFIGRSEPRNFMPAQRGMMIFSFLFDSKGAFMMIFAWLLWYSLCFYDEILFTLLKWERWNKLTAPRGSISVVCKCGEIRSDLVLDWLMMWEDSFLSSARVAELWRDSFLSSGWLDDVITSVSSWSIIENGIIRNILASGAHEGSLQRILAEVASRFLEH